MKILFLAPQPFFEPRGTPINVRRFLTALSELGHEVDVLCFPGGADVKIPNVNIKRVLKIPGAPKPPIGPSRVKIIYDMLMAPHALALRMFKKYDVIHAVEEAGFIAWTIKKLTGTPYIYDMDSHISDQLQYSGFLKNRRAINFIEKWETAVMLDAARIVTVCQYLTDVARRYVDIEKIAQIEDIPIDLPAPPPGITAQSLREKLNIPRAAPVALYTGNLEKYQGIDLVMAAAPEILREAPDVRFVIVGGDEKDVATYRACAVSQGIEASMIFTGAKPMGWMRPLQDMADVLLSPRLEGTNTPLKIYTYLQSGKPIAATDLPTHTQILSSAVAVLAKPEKMEYARAVLLLLKDRTLRERLGAAGKRLVDENYNYDRFRDKVAAAYSGF
ncbi:MAG: glycosyltransferase family 4 protein [Candidatus Nitrospinota bacterium M3_3B_026]